VPLSGSPEDCLASFPESVGYLGEDEISGLKKLIAEIREKKREYIG